MIKSLLGVRSTHAGSRGSHHQGFSLVEVLITVVLLAIVVSLALPSFRDMTEKRQITNGAEQIASFINAAQGISQRSNQRVTLSYQFTDEDEWCLGMAEDDAICNCKVAPAACQVDSQSFVIDNGYAGDKAMMHALNSETSAYYIDPVRGLFLPCQVASGKCNAIDHSSLADMSDPLDIQLRSQSGDFRLSLLVNNTGRVTLCSTDAAHEIPGYAVCP